MVVHKKEKEARQQQMAGLAQDRLAMPVLQDAQVERHVLKVQSRG